MQALNDFLLGMDGYIGSHMWFVFFLLGTGLFFTVYLKFPQIRYFKHAIKVVKGKFDKKTDEGDASHFQALATALSGTVGTGNIGGVALALHIGGPAALFWMLVTAFFGMTTKFVEVTLSHKYREKTEDGTMAGGPMYYMKNKLNMKWLAAIFAFATILSSFGTGNMPQINNISSSMKATFGIELWVTGVVLGVLLALVILGGIKRIVKVTEKLVPSMALIYFIGAFAVIFFNYDNIIPSMVSVFSDIFTGSAAGGGFLGASISFAFTKGVGRGLFSNEAGQGSAPIAHAAAKAHEPVSEGLVAILEPFIDTIIICTVTGLVLLSSGVWNEKFENDFQYTDTIILTGTFDENSEKDQKEVFMHIAGESNTNLFTGKLKVENGKIINDVTVINARSFAENVRIFAGEEVYSGEITIEDGKPQDEEVEYNGSGIVDWLNFYLVPTGNDFTFKGKSLVHSAPLTTEGFKRGFFGDFGQYIVSIGLLLFAFSTAISWSYYGDRATTYLFGNKYVKYYRIIYIAGFVFASFADTTIIWTISAITIAVMTVPNLIGILMLHKDMKSTVNKYWGDFKNDWPEEKTPE